MYVSSQYADRKKIVPVIVLRQFSNKRKRLIRVIMQRHVHWHTICNKIPNYFVTVNTLDMKYLVVLLMAIATYCCSPKLSPDAAWGYQNWVVVELKGVPVQQSGGRRDAHITFDIVQKSFAGNGGCNPINGGYTLDKNEIHFTDVVSTKMSCSDIEFENTFLATLSSVDHYEVRGSDLLLKKKKETVIVLRPK